MVIKIIFFIRYFEFIYSCFESVRNYMLFKYKYKFKYGLKNGKEI